MSKFTNPIKITIPDFGFIESKDLHLKSEVDAHISELEEKHEMEIEQWLIENQKLKSENKKMHEFQSELIKDCKWLPCCIIPTINFFETIVQCTNGKKRVAEFRRFDFKWYDVNNGNKLNVVKWLWQPDMPKDAGKLNDKEA